jgi:hypothetical protein
MNFDKKEYMHRRKQGFRGQKPFAGTPEYSYEQRKINKLARKLRLDKLRNETDQQDIKEIKL